MADHHTITSHLLICVFQSWGHYKTAIGFASKLLQEQPGLIITFVSAGEFTRLSKIELDRYFLHKNPSPKQNFRIVHLGGKGTSFSDLNVCLMQNFPPFCELLCSPGTPIKSHDGLVYSNPRKPDVFICDVFWLDLFQIFRSTPGCTAPVLAWVSPATTCLLVFGPEALRGLGDVPAKAKLLASENGGTAGEIEIELYRPTKGGIIHMYGGIDIYDYEAFPQGHDENPIFPVLVHVYNQAHRMTMDSDGLLFASNTVFEPEALEACKKWCSEVKKSCYVVGPFLFEDDQLETMKYESTAFEVESFMDRIYASRGAQSMLYLSFGTIYWPSGQAIFHVLKVILELKIPLVLSYDATRHGELPPELLAELDSSDIVLVSAWAPQELILNHKACGWFLTHCGLGSIFEAIAQGVPLLAWPIHADQPYNAAYCTLRHDIAYELLEVRTSAGLRPPYRGARPTGTTEAIINEARTVLTKAFGKDGERKRRNIEQLRDKLNMLWKEGGDSLKDMRRFMEDYLPEKV